jgi:hypothetical protein
MTKTDDFLTICKFFEFADLRRIGIALKIHELQNVQKWSNEQNGERFSKTTFYKFIFGQFCDVFDFLALGRNGGLAQKAAAKMSRKCRFCQN